MAESDKTKSAERNLFEAGSTYKAETICARADENSAEYSLRLLKRKLEIVADHHQTGLTLDLCCATGAHLFDLAAWVKPAIGIDFSVPFIERATADASRNQIDDIIFAVGDAKSLPLADESISTAYCLSSLYVIPNVDNVFSELSRVLRPGGRAILDLGNSRSLNAYSVSHYTDIARQHFQTRKQMRRMVEAAGLDIIEQRAFQILPLWADRPSWLWPLLHPGWKAILGARIGGRMIDEWVSNLPLLRSLAFRQMIVCGKPLRKA